MNDRELAQWLQDEAGAHRRLGVYTSAEHLDAAAARIKELGREVADDLEEIIANRVIARDVDTGWRTIERCDHRTLNAVRELVRMGLWEENADLDDIEHIEARPLKGNQ